VGSEPVATLTIRRYSVKTLRREWAYDNYWLAAAAYE
jgi:hypothetical protein